LNPLAAHLQTVGRTTVSGVPAGHDGLLLAGAAAERAQPTLFVARDDATLSRVAETIAFADPALPILRLPAWDCLPYDRVSPNAEIVAQRVNTLTELATNPDASRLILTTVNAVLQLLPPRAALAGETLMAGPGDSLPQDRLMSFLASHGYHRTGTVREAGEFAVRGGIIDIYPPGADHPVRLDFFGDELESVRSFDAMSQRTLQTGGKLVLKPVSEALLNPETIQRFRQGYRECFGAVTSTDPLYEAVTAGRRFPGMEHWLPLYFEKLETLFEYLPAAAVVLDAQVEQAAEARFDTIADHYAARLDLLPKSEREARSRGDGEEAAVYKPVPPEHLFLNDGGWASALAGRAVCALSPFVQPDDGTAQIIDAGGRQTTDFAATRARPDANLFEAVRQRLDSETTRAVTITAHSAGSRERLAGLLREHGAEAVAECETLADVREIASGVTGLAVLDIEHGFETEDLVFISEQDILGERLARPTRSRRRNENFITEVSSLTEGDYVVHVDHGIGRYERLETLEVAGAPHDCLRLIYAGDDKLFVPVENIEMLSRFGSEESSVVLDKLGGQGWQARKARVKERIQEIAEDLIKIAAERTLKKGDVFDPPEGIYHEFCARFGYVETDDQLRAIDDVLSDLEHGRPMDRLICGDVGFGKTEVALRGAFLAAMSGKQVLVVVPTTLLARQHHQTFTERFRGLPLKIATLSRLVTGKDAEAVKSGLADGTIDIAIGTHALLAKSIEARNLGLLIIDEEQHFGVQQKERLKQLRANVHILTLTATPIPRTLQMALSGVKDMSIIATPPVDRLAVRTFVLPYDPVVIREAVQREHFRGGQVFYVCPRIRDISRVEERLKELVPELKIGVAHGQLPARQLESVMGAFLDGRYDILLSTNIVESGLDIPTANTMVVHRADMFGLAQLYQLRGRIGRSKVRAYCYLTVPPDRILTESGERRLEVMQTLDSLGAGFTLASHDMDIRGAGNLLGEEQSGHVREVGVELYQHMLEEAVSALRAEGGESAMEESWSPAIALGSAVLIPGAYVSDLSVRLGLYRRLSTLTDQREIDAFAVELVDRFGPLPQEVENLLQIIRIKQLCKLAGVEKIDAGPKGAVVSFRHDRFSHPERLIGYIQKMAGGVKLRPDHKLVYMRLWDDGQKRLAGVKALMLELSELVA